MGSILAVALNPTIDISCDTERVQAIHKVRTTNQKQYPGGGGTNVARVIAELGGMPELLFLSGGATGKLFEHFLEALPIECHGFPISGEVRVALMVHEKQTGFEYRFVPEGPDVSLEELEPALRFVEKCNADYVVASGSLPKGVPAGTYARLADAVNKRGARFILDTSGDALGETLSKSNVYLVKPSLGELEKLAGRRLDANGVKEAAGELVANGAAENVAVTLGNAGALLVNREATIQLPPVHIKVRSAVGAGDSFTAAMTWWLSRGNSVADAFRFGLAAGSAAVITEGTELCRKADVESIYETLCAG
jgi:6-phosphofructokinase 2